MKNLFERMNEDDGIGRLIGVIAWPFLALISAVIIYLFSHFLFIIKYISNITPTFDVLTAILSVEAIFIGVAIPISLQVISRVNSSYKDNTLSDIFVEQNVYKYQYIAVLSNLVMLVLLFLFQIKNFYVNFIFFIWFSVNIYMFYRFIKLVENYMSNTDEIIISKLRQFVEKIIEE